MSLKNIPSHRFQEEVLQSKKPVLVDFWADGCGPCKEIFPLLKKFAQEQETIRIVQIDVIQTREIALKYQVLSVPTLILFEKGEITQRIVGADMKAISKIFGR